MLKKRTTLTMGILLIVGIFLVISTQLASAQKVAIAVQTVEYGPNYGVGKAYELFATQGMKAELKRRGNLIFAETQDMHCAVAIHGVQGCKTVVFIAVAHNDRNEARKMRDKIRYHMMH